MIMKAIFLEGRNTNYLNECNLTIPFFDDAAPLYLYSSKKFINIFRENIIKIGKTSVKGFEQKNAKKVSKFIVGRIGSN